MLDFIYFLVQPRVLNRYLFMYVWYSTELQVLQMLRTKMMMMTIVTQKLFVDCKLRKKWNWKSQMLIHYMLVNCYSYARIYCICCYIFISFRILLSVYVIRAGILWKSNPDNGPAYATMGTKCNVVVLGKIKGNLGNFSLWWYNPKPLVSAYQAHSNILMVLSWCFMWKVLLLLEPF